MAYKLHLVQELSKDDFDRRVQFCGFIMGMICYSLIILFSPMRGYI